MIVPATRAASIVRRSYCVFKYRPELSPGRAWADVVFRSACPKVADTSVMGARCRWHVTRGHAGASGLAQLD